MFGSVECQAVYQDDNQFDPHGEPHNSVGQGIVVVEQATSRRQLTLVVKEASSYHWARNGSKYPAKKMVQILVRKTKDIIAWDSPEEDCTYPHCQ